MEQRGVDIMIAMSSRAEQTICREIFAHALSTPSSPRTRTWPSSEWAQTAPSNCLTPAGLALPRLHLDPSRNHHLLNGHACNEPHATSTPLTPAGLALSRLHLDPSQNHRPLNRQACNQYAAHPCWTCAPAAPPRPITEPIPSECTDMQSARRSPLLDLRSRGSTSIK